MTPVLGLALALLGCPLLADAGGDLVTAAGASARPRECSARAQSGRSPSVWERARTPQRAAYCSALAQAHARLGTDLDGAQAAAQRAEEAWPGRAATRVALGRVKLARGDVKGALTDLDEAQRLDPRAVVDPASLRDLARALARGGRGEEAMGVYRALIPQSSLLPRGAQAAALVEAALATMAAPRSPGPAADAAAVEALAFLREARSLPANPVVAETALVLALALDRSGDATGAAAQLADAARMGASAEQAGQRATDLADAAALLALATEGTDRAAAAAAWDRYLAEAKAGAWREAAERRRDALRSGTQGPAPARRRTPSR